MWLEYTDSHGQRIWDTLMGVESRPLTTVRSTLHPRELIDSWWTQVCERAASHRAQQADPLLDAIRASASLALTREKAIAHGIERRQARMAARLIQGALFDRRTERDAVAQRELIRLALARCRARTAALERLDNPTVAIRPAFALLSW